ncbi:MAG: transporter [Deltaproteobacteria bacterium SM23_61]|nr:MAG: transporter [Deltaproteobacteria bacterium SM23_61]
MATQRWLPLIAAVFVTSLIIANIIAVKLVSIGPLILPAAILIFPVSYIFGDILTEVYGYARARRVIWIGFGCNLLAVIVIWLSIELPPAPFWKLGPLDSPQSSQQAYRALFGFTPRILVASFIAYLMGEFLNSYVLAKMKIATEGRHLWLRTIGSTIVGQFADSAVFIFLAFAAMIPSGALGKLVVTQWLTKSAYEALVTPLTYGAVNYLKRVEREDHYDRETDFNPLKWKD